MRTEFLRINNSDPAISVIITVFNRKKKLLRALSSVLAQTFTDFEIIIIDDGSDDKVENLIFPFLRKHTFIKYIRHSNRHSVRSLNTGLCLAAGKFITFLDSDDEYMPEHIKKRIDFLKRNKSIDLLHSPAILIGKEEDFYVPDANNNNKLIHLKDCTIGATFFGKSKVFKTLNGFKPVFSYDSEFLKRASDLFNVKKYDCLTYNYYRNSKDSVLSKIKKNME